MESHGSCSMNHVLYGFKISTQNANSTWLSLNMLNSFLQHYTLAQAAQLQLGLAVCPYCGSDHTKTAKADISQRIINEILLFTQCFTLTLEEVLSTQRDC